MPAKGTRAGVVAELAEIFAASDPRPGILAFAWRHSIPEPNTGCWIYERGWNKGNYGIACDPRVPVNRKSPVRILIHRLVCEAVHGRMGSELQTRHACDNPPCINPAHLLPGTMQDNMDDKMRRGRGADTRAEKNGRAKITSAQVAEILRRIADDPGIVRQRLAKEYGVARGTIGHITAGRVWRDVSRPAPAAY